MARLTRLSALDASSGLILAARGHSLTSALLFSIAFETGSAVTHRVAPRTFPQSSSNDPAQFALNVFVSMVGWFIGTQFRGR